MSVQETMKHASLFDFFTKHGGQQAYCISLEQRVDALKKVVKKKPIAKRAR
jgi:chloramphenicol O-acetyltransferase